MGSRKSLLGNMCSDLPDQGRLLPTRVSSNFVNRALGEKNKSSCNSLVDFYICKQFPHDLHSSGQDCLFSKQIHFVWKLGEEVPGEFSWIHLGVTVLLSLLTSLSSCLKFFIFSKLDLIG